MNVATRVRYTVLYFTLALAVITYLDRVAIASAATAIRGELGLSAAEMGWVFSAFTFAYAAFEIPSGWLGDVIGPRKVLTRIVLWWSGLTMVTGLAWNFVTLLIARFLFGVGEAGAFPNISRSFAKWFPTEERGHAHGVVFMGTRLGGAIAPPLVVLLTSLVGWRRTFMVLGGIGVVWCVFWWRWFRDEPSLHPAVNAAERERIERGVDLDAPERLQWRQLLSVNLLLICAMYFCMAYTLYFNLTWLPTYLQEVRGFTARQAGLLAGVVLLMGAIGTYVGGKLTDYLVTCYGLKIGRSLGAITLPISGALLAAAAMTEDALTAAILLAATLGVADLCVSACWSMCHDIGGKNTGVVSACMNTFGNIGGAISPLVVGYAVQWWSSWTLPFYITAGVYVMGGVLTLLIDPRKRLMVPAPVPRRVPAVPIATTMMVLLCGAWLVAQGPPAARPARKQVLAWADIRNGVQHDSVTRALVTIERLGRESGAYDTYIRTDSQLITKQPITMPGNPRPITNKNLDYFDAIFFMGLREIDLTAAQKADLLSFVKEDGKGFVAAHTADTAFFSWAEFGEMLGGRFDEHPWNVTDATVIIEDPQFPAMKYFPLRSVVRDEHYQTKDFSREKIRVLARLDPSSVDLKNPRVHRTDGDFPVAWAKTYGKGRVFYSTLGHGAEMWDNPALQTMYFEAMRWSLGLVPGDATPRPQPAGTPREGRR